MYTSNLIFYRNQNGPYGQYEPLVWEISPNKWPKNRVFDENSLFRKWPCQKLWEMFFWGAENLNIFDAVCLHCLKEYTTTFHRPAGFEWNWIHSYLFLPLNMIAKNRNYCFRAFIYLRTSIWAMKRHGNGEICILRAENRTDRSGIGFPRFLWGSRGPKSSKIDQIW